MSDAYISLKLLGSETLFEVNGDLVSSYRFNASLNALNGKLISDTCVQFSYLEGEEEKKYTEIERLFLKFGVNLLQDISIQTLLQKLNDENLAFQEFSQKAKKIRNNEHSIPDFKEFTDIIHHMFKDRTLYELQLLSAYHLAFSQNACNFSVPGAGKTSIVYAAYAYLKNLPKTHPQYKEKHVNRLLIISPLAAFFPWKDEYQKCFGKPPIYKEMVGLTSKQRTAIFHSSEEIELVLISYQSAAISEDDIINIQDYLKRHNVMLVLDEAHKIKNTDGGKIAEGIKSLSRYAKARVVLTGTPAPNGYQDLYNLYKFIWPTKNIIPFPLPYLREMSDSVSPSIKANIEKLTDYISPFFIRITKSSLDLPTPFEHKPVIVPMNESQRIIYEYIANKFLSGDVDSLDVLLKKARLIRLLQCSSNPTLLSEAVDEFSLAGTQYGKPVTASQDILNAINKFNTENPNKYTVAKDLILNLTKSSGPKGKVIVWMLFIKGMHKFKEYLESYEISCELLYGATPNENEFTPEDVKTREKIISKFHEEDCPYKVIIANPFAVGESISLHKACRNAIYLEKNFNAAMYIQSKDRIHRYGLKKPDDVVNYYYLVSENSIDEVIHSRLLEKEERMLYLIEREPIPLLDLNTGDSGVDDDDFKSVLKHYYDRRK